MNARLFRKDNNIKRTYANRANEHDYEDNGKLKSPQIGFFLPGAEFLIVM